jgi:DNA-binding XRE family transcriptional regulator
MDEVSPSGKQAHVTIPDTRTTSVLAAVGDTVSAPLFTAFKEEALESEEAREAYQDAVWVHEVIKRCRELREEAGLTQRQIAERIGVSQSMISEFENEISNPRILTIARYARAVGAQFIFNVYGPGECTSCGHALHEDECEEITGYDHMNGDHVCGCPWRG